jgi:hypothetical protein
VTFYVETTVLTDALLKAGIKGTLAKLKEYPDSELPVYAIKEFKAGPLRAARWLHNTLYSTKSFSATLNAIGRLLATPRRYMPRTAMELVTNASTTLLSRLTGDAAEMYAKAPPERQDQHLAREYEDEIKGLIFRAWLRRRRLTTRVVQPLSCYEEADPYEKRGLIELDPTNCAPAEECCLAALMRASPEELKKLREVCMNSPKQEMQGRTAILKRLIKGRGAPLNRDECRRLGDVIFAFFAPAGSTILTTNLSDHVPLAEALGKTAQAP